MATFLCGFARRLLSREKKLNLWKRRKSHEFRFLALHCPFFQRCWGQSSQHEGNQPKGWEENGAGLGWRANLKIAGIQQDAEMVPWREQSVVGHLCGHAYGHVHVIRVVPGVTSTVFLTLTTTKGFFS